MNEMNQVNKMSSKNHGGLYTSQAAEIYLQFPVTVSPCSDWLLCQAEAVCTKTVTLVNYTKLGDVLMHIYISALVSQSMSRLSVGSLICILLHHI